MRKAQMRLLPSYCAIFFSIACSSEADPPASNAIPVAPTVPVGTAPAASLPVMPVAPTNTNPEGVVPGPTDVPSPEPPTDSAPVTPEPPVGQGTEPTTGEPPSPSATGTEPGPVAPEPQPTTTGTGDVPAPSEPDPVAQDAVCSEMPAPNEEITAFDNFDWEAGDGSWGTEPNLTGGYFTYAGTGSELQPYLSEEEPQLRLIGNVQNYFGFGLWFGPCVDASQYLGISFTIKGELGDPAAVEEDPLLNGEVELQIQTSKNYVVDEENKKGECTGSWDDGTCKSNSVVVELDDSEPLVEILWEDFSGGVPEATVSPNQLLGLQWQFNCEEVEGGPGCDMDITIDDVQFIVP